MRLAVLRWTGRLVTTAGTAWLIALGGVAAGPALAATPPATAAVPQCPATVIPGGAVMPGAVGCWNAIAVQSVRLGAQYNVQGLIYMGYVQAAVYDAVTKIEGRFAP